MSTVQIIGVAVAAAAVLLLVIALVVARRGAGHEQDEDRTGPSFLDEGPQDTFSALGKPEQPVEDITLDPSLDRAIAAERRAAAAQAQDEKQPQPGGLGLDWGPDLSVRELPPDPVASASRGDEEETTGELRPGDETDETEITGELRPADETDITGFLQAAQRPAGQPKDAPPAPEANSEDQTADTEPARPAAGGPAAGDEAAQESGSDVRLVPLSDIIVTTSSKRVDLRDPDVRRMLTELVTYEIDQAADFRRRGQDIDAVLQLTEAEKVSRALGMTEAAQRIRAMMREIDEQE